MGARFPVSYHPQVRVDGVLYNRSSESGNKISVTLSGYQWSTMTCDAVATAGSGYVFTGWEFASECPDGWAGSTSQRLTATETGTSQDPIDGYQMTIIGCFKSNTPPPVSSSYIEVSTRSGPQEAINDGCYATPAYTDRRGPGTPGSIEQFTLNAVDDWQGNWTFDHWEDEDGNTVSFSNPYNFSLSYPSTGTLTRTFKAVFRKVKHTIIVIAYASPWDAGTAEVTPPIYYTGRTGDSHTFHLKATPYSHYVFKHWELPGGGTDESADLDVTLTIGDSDETFNYKAVFEEHNGRIDASVAVSPDNSGQAEVYPTYAEGHVGNQVAFIFNARDSYPYHFVRWSDGSRQREDYEIRKTITEEHQDLDLVAYFELDYGVKVVHLNVGPNSTESGKTYIEGRPGGTETLYGSQGQYSARTLFAEANEGYVFEKWTIDGVDYSDASVQYFVSFNFEESERTINAVAYFRRIERHTITATATSNPESGGTAVVSPSSFTDYEGTQCVFTFKATASNGFRFLKWSDGNVHCEHDVESTVGRSDSSISLVAEFVRITGLILYDEATGLMIFDADNSGLIMYDG